MKKSWGWYAQFLVAAYVSCILLANLTLNQFIALPFYGLLSVGTIFFAAIFTLRDRIHHIGGLRLVYIAIALAVLVNALAAWYVGTPWRFIIASFLGILFGELTDTAIYHSLQRHNWAVRVMSSNAVSVPLDSTLFTLLAFYGDMSWTNMLQIILTDIVAKYSISLLLMLRWTWRTHRRQPEPQV